jgi:hypothetical protein
LAIANRDRKEVIIHFLILVEVKRVYVKRIIEILELSTLEIGNMQIDDSIEPQIDSDEIEEEYD